MVAYQTCADTELENGLDGGRMRRRIVLRTGDAEVQPDGLVEAVGVNVDAQALVGDGAGPSGDVIEHD